MQCADCASELDDALILVCDHNLCLSCAAKKSAGVGAIRCRVCGSMTHLEQNSALQLKEMFPQFSTTPRPRPPLAAGPPANTCGQCDYAKADLRCLQCEEYLCFDCSETLHKRGKMASHQIVAATQQNTVFGGAAPTVTAGASPVAHYAINSPQSTSRSMMMDRSVITMRSIGCHSHPEEPIQYFCLRCETRPMCAECVFRSGEHTSHLNEVVLVKKAFPKIKSRMNDLIVSFQKSIKENKFFEQNLFENKKSIETIGSNSRIQVGKYFADIRQLLKDKETELLRQIDSSVDAEICVIDQEIRECGQKRDKIESVSRLLHDVSGTENIGGSITEREIEVLESFSEMKSIIASSNSGQSADNTFRLVQLYIPHESVATMDKNIGHIREEISQLAGIVPTRGTAHKDPSPAVSAAGSSGRTRKSKTSSRRTSKDGQDMFLINAIDDAIRSA